MAFESILPVSQASMIIEKCLKQKSDARTPDRKEMGRLQAMTDVITQHLTLNFPSINQTGLFYQQMISQRIGTSRLKIALSRVEGTKRQIIRLSMQTQRKLSKVEDPRALGYHTQGRIISMIKQIEQSLDYLEDVRIIFRTWPTIKELPTLCLVGFPNVGKSTLLSKLTTAKPKIANYAFTTLGVNVGYATFGYYKVQFLDTPGVLHRPKKNDVELIAYTAQKYASDAFIMVVDPTQDYDTQMELLHFIKRFDKPIYVYVSKLDIVQTSPFEQSKESLQDWITATVLDIVKQQGE
ncbi:MAG: GTPase [Candidatus Woesearchaeota archaeon]